MTETCSAVMLKIKKNSCSGSRISCRGRGPVRGRGPLTQALFSERNLVRRGPAPEFWFLDAPLNRMLLCRIFHAKSISDQDYT